MRDAQANQEVSRATFADNQRVTVSTAIRNFATYDGHRRPISIATAYFNVGGFSTIADTLEAAPSVRILLGAEPRPLTSPDILSADLENVAQSVEAVADSLRAERDALPFNDVVETDVKRLLTFLARSTTEVKIYRKKFLHGKAFIFSSEAAVIAGSANFTAAGLQHNLELDLGQYDPDKVTAVATWFEDLWRDAEIFDLANVFSSRVQEYEPYQIYMRILLALYGEEVAVDEKGFEQLRALQLAEFQQLGSRRAIRILDEWGGAMLADGVGLGKTLIAGDILKQFAIDRGLYVLVVCPASLREMWEAFLHRQNLPGMVLSYTQLARENQLTGGEGHELTMPPSSYHLIVADEAHALRNPDTQHYRAMQKLLTLAQNSKLLMLTATPVNNTLWDLYYEIMLFAKGDSRFARLGIPSLRDHFRVAGRAAADELSPTHLFPILDAIAVRRTRTFVKEHFPDTVVQTPSGPLRIAFPVVHVLPVRYDFDAIKPGLFPRVAEAIEHRLTMARYRTQSYARPARDVARQEFLAGLLRSQMLKRFESSSFAFIRTLDRMIEAYERTLRLIDDRGMVPVINLDAEEDLLDEANLVRLVDEGALEPASGYDVQNLRQDLAADVGILRALRADLADLKAVEDPKLLELREILLNAASESGDKRKTLVFTAYSDTVNYIRGFLERQIDEDRRLEGFRGRVAFVAGDFMDADERGDIAVRFAPRSMLPDFPAAPDDFDILVTTDVLAEGQNLQQCGRLVNFDLPWNPMRIVQRNGRIDRIGSPHGHVDVYCTMPDEELEAVLGLEERLQRKIAQASASIGIEGEIIPGTVGQDRVFIGAEDSIRRLARGDANVIDELEHEDAYSGEVFREELRQQLAAESKGNLEALPWGIGSGFQNPKHEAVVFLAKAGGRYVLRRTTLGSDAPIEDDLLSCVMTARCTFGTARYLPDALRSQLYHAWGRARDDVAQWFAEQRDPRRRQAAVPKVQREAVDLLQRASDDEAWRAAEALGSPWPIDVQRQLRAILRDTTSSDREKVVRLIAYTKERGLKALPGPVFPEVSPADVHLVCFQSTTG